MSRFCNKHIHERSDDELREYVAKAETVLKTEDPRSQKGRRALKQKTTAQDVLQRRENAKKS